MYTAGDRLPDFNPETSFWKLRGTFIKSWQGQIAFELLGFGLRSGVGTKLLINFFYSNSFIFSRALATRLGIWWKLECSQIQQSSQNLLYKHHLNSKFSFEIPSSLWLIGLWCTQKEEKQGSSLSLSLGFWKSLKSDCNHSLELD